MAFVAAGEILRLNGTEMYRSPRISRSTHLWSSSFLYLLGKCVSKILQSKTTCLLLFFPLSPDIDYQYRMAASSLFLRSNSQNSTRIRLMLGVFPPFKTINVRSCEESQAWHQEIRWCALDVRKWQAFLVMACRDVESLGNISKHSTDGPMSVYFFQFQNQNEAALRPMSLPLLLVKKVC